MKTRGNSLMDDSKPAPSSSSQSEPLFESETEDASTVDDETNEQTRTSFNLRPRHDTEQEGSEGDGDDASASMEVDGRDDASSSEDDDEHEDACALCRKDTRPEKLLCCDSCPDVYHLDCLDPPLVRVPKGNWSCPQCAGIQMLKEIERILAEKEDEMETGEYYVKWKGKSYRHCSWVKKDDFSAAKRQFSYLHAKLRSFESKEEEDVELEAYDPTEFVNGVHRNWTVVEKVLDAKDANHRVFLVKWKDLGHDQCTWESVEDISDATEQISDFRNQVSIRKEAHVRMRKKRGSRGLSIEQEFRSKDDGRFTETPSFLREGCQLHAYQLEGLNWLKFKWGQEESVILADEMGLGKTIQAIAFLASLWDEGVDVPHLVVVPLSTVQNWLREFELWAPQLKVVAIVGNKTSRETILKHEIYLSKNLKDKKRHRTSRNMSRKIKCHVILTSYEMVSLESAKLGKIDYECLIVDEGHRLKAKGSKLVKELNNFNCHHRMLLTGTPLQNNIQELFALLHFIDARKFDSWESFEEDFAEISEEEQVKKLHGLLSPHLLRRMKNDVLKGLPPKKEQIIRVEMTEAQREMYKSILAQNFHLLITDKQSRQVRHGLLSVMMELRKCTAHPYLFEGVETTTPDKHKELTEMINICGKLQLLDRMLAKLKERGHRVLIYSQFVIMLNILEDYLELKRYGFLRIDGTVGGADRQTLIDAYNNEQDKYFVFLLSTRSGGLGINLATADTVILYDSDYNPHNDIQAQARAHRLGQERPVMIYRLVTRLTIEERMMQLAKEKLVLEQIVVRKMGNETLKQDELDGILQYGAAELFADERLADTQGKGLTVIEQETERLAAGTGSARIVYDEEALDKLLDRSDMTTADDDKMEANNGELMDGFKIANFEVTVKERNPQNYWRDLLMHRKDVQEKVQQQGKESYIITPGRRRRRNDVIYRIDDAVTDDSLDSEYNAEGQEPEESESTDLEADLPLGEEVTSRGKKQRVREGMPEASAAKTRKKPNFVSWHGTELMIFDFTTRERQLFLNLLLRFGFPDEALDASGKVDWTEFTSRLPRKKHQFIDDYARLLVSAAGGDLPPNVKKEDMLFECRPEDLLAKIGMMHLFRRKLRSVAHLSSRLWINGTSARALYSTQHWTEAQDWALLRAVVRHGHGRWKDYLNNGENELEAVLRRELVVEVPTQDEAIDLSSSPDRDAADGADTAAQEREAGAPNPETESERKSRVRSTETKCRNWMANRLRTLVEFMSTEQEPTTQSRSHPRVQIAQHQPATTLVVSGSLRWKYQSMVRQCFSVRECSNQVTGQQSYAELQTAGVQFRTQMTELKTMAQGLSVALPDDYKAFRNQEADLKTRELGSSWKPLARRSAVLLDPTLGTSASTHELSPPPNNKANHKPHAPQSV